MGNYYVSMDLSLTEIGGNFLDFLWGCPFAMRRRYVMHGRLCWDFLAFILWSNKWASLVYVRSDLGMKCPLLDLSKFKFFFPIWVLILENFKMFPKSWFFGGKKKFPLFSLLRDGICFILRILLPNFKHPLGSVLVRWWGKNVEDCSYITLRVSYSFIWKWMEEFYFTSVQLFFFG